MRNIANKPRQLINLDIIFILLVYFLALTFYEPLSSIGAIGDWSFYDSYVEAVNDLESVNAQEMRCTAEGESKDEHISPFYVSDISSETQVLFDKAMALIRTRFGNQSLFLWEHWNYIQFKDCSLDSSKNIVLAFYEPEKNTIYCNRDVLYQPQLDDRRLTAIVHELMHSLLERDSTALYDSTSAFHEGFTEYLAQTVCPTDSPSYFMNYCLAEVFVKDNGLDRAIELFMTGQAEESINQRLGKENLIQNINSPLYALSVYPLDKTSNSIILDVYLHYVQATGVNVETHIDQALNRIPLNIDNLARIIYFNDLHRQAEIAATKQFAAAFSWIQKYPSFLTRVSHYLIIKRSF